MIKCPYEIMPSKSLEWLREPKLSSSNWDYFTCFTCRIYAAALSLKLVHSRSLKSADASDWHKSNTPQPSPLLHIDEINTFWPKAQVKTDSMDKSLHCMLKNHQTEMLAGCGMKQVQ